MAFGIKEKEVDLVQPDKGRITTILKPRYEMGRCAAESLLHQVKHGYTQSGLIKLKTRLLIGDTSGPAPSPSA